MKRLDFLVVGGLLAAAVLVFFGLRFLSPQSPATVVEVYIGGVLTETHPLPQEGEQELLIQTEEGQNRLLLTSSSVRVDYADCDSQDCVRSAPLTAPGQVTACLPHRLLVRLAGAQDRGEVDVVAG